MADTTYSRDIAQIIKYYGTLNPSKQRFKSFETYCEEVLKPETREAIRWHESFWYLALNSYAGRIAHEKGIKNKHTRNIEADMPEESSIPNND